MPTLLRASHSRCPGEEYGAFCGLPLVRAWSCPRTDGGGSMGGSRRKSREFVVDRTALVARGGRWGRRKSPVVAGAAAAARACAMARRPHIARGRSETCARRRERWRGAPFLPAARVPSSARACAHGAWRVGKEGDSPPPHFPTCGRACVRSTKPQEARLERPSSPPRSRLVSSEQTYRASTVGAHLEGRRAERRQLQQPHGCFFYASIAL